MPNFAIGGSDGVHDVLLLPRPAAISGTALDGEAYAHGTGHVPPYTPALSGAAYGGGELAPPRVEAGSQRERRGCDAGRTSGRSMPFTDTCTIVSACGRGEGRACAATLSRVA